MGYFYAQTRCPICGKDFEFNPARPPIIEVDNDPVVICKQCLNRINLFKGFLDQELLEVAEDAYEPCTDTEMNIMVLPYNLN